MEPYLSEKGLRTAQESSSYPHWLKEGRLFIQFPFQDGLNRPVAGITKGISSGTGLFKPFFFIFILQPQDTLALTKIMKGVLFEETFYSLPGRRTDLAGFMATPLRSTLEESHFFRWIVIPVRNSPSPVTPGVCLN